jgi:hypothetical protein
LLWARRGTATINQSGGSVHVTNWAVIGVEGGSRGHYNLTGTSEGDGIAQFDNELNLGRLGAIGTVDVGTGGVMNVNGWTTIGRDGGPVQARSPSMMVACLIIFRLVRAIS